MVMLPGQEQEQEQEMTYPIPPVPQKPPPSVAELMKEYVAGGIPGWLGPRAATLSWSIDEAMAAFGIDIYERMLLDPQVYADVLVLMAAVIEDGFTFGAAVTDSDDPDFALAHDIRDECEAMYTDLPTDNILFDQLSAFWNGYSIAEVTYGDRPSVTSNKTLLNVTEIKVKAPNAVAFVVDSYLNIIGILALTPGIGVATLSGLYVDPAQTPNLLPREKFCILTNRPRYADPRGSSILRPVFEPWNDKQQLLPDYRKYLAQFAGPSLAGYTPPGAQSAELTNPDGTPLLGADGKPIKVPAQTGMLRTLIEFQNGTAAVFPAGAKVEPIMVAGDGKPFLASFARSDMQITKAVLTQILTTEEGEHQARAAASVHQDVQDTLVRQGKRSVQRAHRYDVLRQWVKVNWGEKYMRLAPIPTLGLVEQHDMYAMMNGVANLKRAGYFYSQAQLLETDRMLGLPERDLSVPGDVIAAPASPGSPLTADRGSGEPPFAPGPSAALGSAIEVGSST